MKFFSETKELSVFHRRKKIANFENGEFETNDSYVIEKLKPHFRYKGNKVKTKVLNYWILKEKAEKLGIKTYGMKKKEIIEALEEVK